MASAAEESMNIAFIGFGEAAQAFAASLGEHGGPGFAAFDILNGTGRDQRLRDAAARLGVDYRPSAEEAVRSAEWVFSAVTAADCLDAALSVAPLLGDGQVFFDINSVSAGRKREAAAMVTRNGAAYVDMAVMAPVHPRGHRTPVLIAGPDCAAVHDRLAGLGFELGVAGDAVGAATAVKMLRSLFVKGMEAVTVQTLLAARAAGCLDVVHESLAGSFPGLGWPDFARYQLERVARHGIRRSAEMVESAAAQDELGFAAGNGLGLSIAALQAEIGGLGVGIDPDEDLPASLDRVLEALRTRS